MTYAQTSPTWPRAHAICDRCGARYNHDQLRWQHDWRGPRMQNLRILVCQDCYDAPQQNGQRTILIPADPVPIMNPRPEFYVSDNNPLSGIGYSPIGPAYGAFLGTLSEGGGAVAAFNANPNKPFIQSAMTSVAHSSYNNWVGVNWSEAPATITPSSLNSPVIHHTLLSWEITAPNDMTFGSTAYVVQGSQTNIGWGSWVTIASGNPVGTVGEVISGDGGLGRFQFHRVAFLQNTSGPIAVAKVSFSVAETSSAGGTV